MKQLKILLLMSMITLFTTYANASVNMAPIISYLLSDTEPQGEITINDPALKKVIASAFDNTPYTPAIDIQGVIDAGGLTVTVPYTVTNASATLEAYSTSVILDAAVTQDDEAGIVATFSWTEQTNLPVGSGTFTATITIDDSGASIPDNTYNAKQLDVEDDSAGLVAATFSYDTDNVGGTGVLTLKIVAGIPDRMYGVADNTGNAETHNFLYLPVTNTTTGKTWLNNNLGANYANVNDPAFNLTQQATASNDHNAYGSLFQWGRKADGHELITSTTSTGTNGTTTTSSDNPTDALFIIESPDWRVNQDDTLWASESSANNVCPVGYRVPTEGELDGERVSWVTDGRTNDAAGALGGELKLPMPGYRDDSYGTVYNEGTYGFYWGATVSGTSARNLYFYGSDAHMTSHFRAYGFTVRCIKDVEMIINENFDAETVGTLASGWLLLYNGTGDANQKVVDTLYKSPNHSFQLEGSGGWSANIYKVPSSIPNNVIIESNIYIDEIVSGMSGWIAFLNKDTGSWGTTIGGLNYENGKFFAHTEDNLDGYEISNFIPQQWYHIKIVYDTVARTFQVYIDGTLATGTDGVSSYTTFPMHQSVGVASDTVLMLTAGNGDTVKVFYDDVKMYENP